MRLPWSLVLLLTVALPLAAFTCPGRATLPAEQAFHLEERFAEAEIEGREIPQSLLDVLPPEAGYTRAPVGAVTESRGGISRQAVYFHVPGKLRLRIRVPFGGARLDFGLGVLRDDVPVKFRIKGDSILLATTTWTDSDRWYDRSTKLSRFAGQTITLEVQTMPVRVAEGSGTIALWAAPTIVREDG